jgi:hypothetical protein
MVYTRRHGDCSVPRGWAEDPRLANWVSDQWKRKKALDCGEPSHGMTAERAAKLEALDFTWAFMKLDRSVPSEGMTAARAAKLEALDFDSAPHSGGAEIAGMMPAGRRSWLS